jgi:hypothetical protein
MVISKVIPNSVSVHNISVYSKNDYSNATVKQKGDAQQDAEI